jgi:hypothetical protein
MRLVLLVLAVLFLGFAPVFVYGKTHSQIDLYGNFVQLVALGVAGYSFLQIQNPPSELFRKACNYLTVGMWIWGVGQVMITYSELLLHSSPYGTVSSCFFVLGYCSIFFGCICFLRHFEPSRKQTVRLIIIVTLSLTICLLLLANEIADPQRSVVFKFLDVAYSAFDFMILAIAGLLMIASKRSKTSSGTKAFALFFCAFLLLAVMDILVTDVYFETLLYRAVDIAYVGCYFLIALSGYAMGQTDRQLTTTN